MTLNKIPINALTVKIHDLWNNQWLLLTSGDFAKKEFNTMTVAWGSLGIMWGKPLAQVVVRPTRYTYQFMERYPHFTLCAFPEQYRSALELLGTRSGRDGDKISDAGLTPIPSQTVSAPAFAEAELILECNKMYWDDFDPSRFLLAEIEDNYPGKDYHRIYFGEIANILGSKKYRS